MTTFHDVLQREKVLLADGAMGTELLRRGMPRGMPSCLWNRSRGDEVLGVHQRYIDAGARLLWTNTFGADRATLHRIREADQTMALVRAGVTWARRAAGATCLVAGSMGPSAVPWKSLDADERQAQRDAWVEQAEILAGEGVDAIVIETITTLAEGTTLLEAVRDGITRARRSDAVSVMACLCPMRAEAGALTLLSGEDFNEGMALLAADELIARGANCGVNVSSDDWRRVAELFREQNEKGVLLLKINAGTPVDGAWPLEPRAFADTVVQAIGEGRAIVGGCCGTTPEHLEALRRALEQR